MSNPSFFPAPDRCTLFPRRCMARRAQGQAGFSGAAGVLKAARAALHFLGGALHQRTAGQRHGVFLRVHPEMLLLPENYPISAEVQGEELSVGPSGGRSF